MNFSQDWQAIHRSSGDRVVVGYYVVTQSGIIGVGTASYGSVPVTIEIYDREPPVDTSEWDRVMEASIDLKSGQLLICGCPDEFVGQISLTPGTYRVRIHYGGLETVKDEEGDDYYQIFLWLGQYEEVRAIA